MVEESVQKGYVERLSKGQAMGVEQLEQVRAASKRVPKRGRPGQWGFLRRSWRGGRVGRVSSIAWQ